nr:MAG TPA: hypothetical protein [Caudoviricetes sp.]
MEHNEKINATLNIGMTTKHYMPINVKTAMRIISLTTDCTMTECVGVYKGHMEKSLKVEIYNTTCENAVELAREFAREFVQECVACTVRWKTVFVADMATEEEREELTSELENQ